ncbi:MAG: LLM class flavin-dependent oxidoreductase [Actinobacteria bacterium]|nr:LLM class flavin-dependent oxidoreductase [Actinomycetota bacterium]
MRIGIGVSEDLTIAAQRELAREVEDAGFASLWTNEARGRDSLLVCQAWADATEALEVGVGVVPLWTRSAAQLAMAAATLQEASDGRFLLGLGVSHPGTMGPWHGADYRKPLTAARETLEVLRTLGEGEQADVEGEVVRSRHFRLGITPTPARTPVYLAAMGPRMLSLAGERADGVLLNWSSPDEVRRAGDRVRGAARDAGRDEVEVPVATYVRVAVDADRDAARRALAQEVGQYAALPAYASHFERQGFGDAVGAVKAAYKEGGKDAVPDALDDDVLASLGWYGTPDDDPADALAAYDDAGLDHLVARVVVVGDDPRRTVRAVLTALHGATA